MKCRSPIATFLSKTLNDLSDDRDRSEEAGFQEYGCPLIVLFHSLDPIRAWNKSMYNRIEKTDTEHCFSEAVISAGKQTATEHCLD
jgi:hypothetical protein